MRKLSVIIFNDHLNLYTISCYLVLPTGLKIMNMEEHIAIRNHLMDHNYILPDGFKNNIEEVSVSSDKDVEVITRNISNHLIILDIG
jgi:hypothetical protein